MKSDGTLWAWGAGNRGQLGNNGTAFSNVPVQVHGLNDVGFLTGVKGVAVGANFSMALLCDGRVMAWGASGLAQLGNGDWASGDKLTPVFVVQVGGGGQLQGAVSISANGGNGAAVLQNGTLVDWGNSSMGQLGNGNTTFSDTPVHVRNPGDTANLTGVTQTSTGYYFGTALLSDGTVYCWGDNSNGQLGDGTVTERHFPVQASGITTAKKIGAGSYFTMALLNDGICKAWGDNSKGQQGDWNWTDNYAPRTVKDLTGCTSIGVGYTHALFLTTAYQQPWVYTLSPGWALAGGSDFTFTVNGQSFVPGSVVTWNGADRATTYVNSCKLTAAITAADIASVGSATITVHSPAPGGAAPHTLPFSIKTPMKIVATGLNDAGQLGDGSLTNRNLPGHVTGLETAVSVSSGTDFTLALMSDGTLRSWGSNAFGQLGDGTTNNSNVPVTVKGVGGLGTLSNITAVSVGATHALALRNDGRVYVWGRNDKGQFGDGTTTDSSTPILIPGVSNIAAVSGGGQWTLALTNDGTCLAWGAGGNGQLGDANGTDSLTPVQVSGLSDQGILDHVIEITTGNFFGMALVDNAGVRSWGQNDFGQLGDNTSGTDRLFPVAVVGEGGPGYLGGVTQISASRHFSLALKATGGVRAWGRNDSGQLGDATQIDRFYPVTTAGLANVVSISAGQTTSGAVINDGSAYGWGGNGSGQIGDGTTTTPRIAATAVNGFSGGKEISGGSYSTCFLTTDDLVPRVDTISPTWAYHGSAGFSLALSGASFTPETVVRWNGSDRVTHFTSATAITADITAADIASPGTASVTAFNPAPGGGVSSPTKTFTMRDPQITSVSPTSGAQGQTMNVDIVASDTSFVNGPSVASFGAGITVNSTTVTDATHARANITIDPAAAAGTRDVNVTTGGETPDPLVAGFTVRDARISNVVPQSGAQGQTMDVDIIASSTAFVNGTSVASFGAGITVNSTTVSDTFHARANITIAAGAAPGTRDVNVITSGETPDPLTAGFTVRDAKIASVSPTSGAQGQTVTVAIVGTDTTFVNGVSVASFGAGITINSTGVIDATHAVASITIAAGAAAGTRDVNVTTGGETPDLLVGGFTVHDAKMTSVNPASGAQGQTMNVAIVGTDTAFVNGVSVASFGAGITVNSTTVTDATHATANTTIAAGAAAGTRDVNITTAGETPDPLVGGFTVRDAKIASVNPTSGAQGQTMNVAIVGTDTAFVNGVSVASFGAGITINSTGVVDATHATANITIASGATPGTRDVNVVTGGETPDPLTAGFTVRDAKIAGVLPTSGAQGQTMNVIIAGTDTAFVNGISAADFGAGITVNDTAVTDATHAIASITIAAGAAAGTRDMNVVTGGETPDALIAGFTVRDAKISSVNPTSGAQGQTMNVNVTGTDTAFVNGISAASFGAGITVNSTNVTDDTHATANITIAAGATPGTRNVNVVTGGETPDLLAACFTVRDAQITNVLPLSGAQGQTMNVSVYGSGTAFAAGISLADFGAGITINSTTVSSANWAVANITIASGATPGTRDVNVITGGETPDPLVAGFTVRDAQITSVSPTSGAQGQTMNIAVVGSSTTFADGDSIADFGAGITVNTTTVTDPTHATANITIASGATPGTRDVNVVTGGETPDPLTAGFTVRDAKIVSMSPTSGAQGQTMSVDITGADTRFVNGTSTAGFGAGITVNSTTVLDSAHAFASITIDPAATPGTRDVNIVTGGETPDPLSGGFTVRDAKISSITPVYGWQGETKNVDIVGSDTAFVNGTSTASFGAGITVNSTTVTDLTHATANITISAAAAEGPRDVNVVTGGETPDPLAAGFAVSHAKIYSVNPTSGAQGQTTLTKIVGDGYKVGVSVPSFGAGITVNSIDFDTAATTITANITIAAGATPGPRDVEVVTGGVTSGPLIGGFTVRDAKIASISTTSARQGATLDVTIVGTDTAFVNGPSTADFGAGIIVNSTTVTDATHASANITVQTGAAAGTRDVNVITYGETPDSLTAGFTVQNFTLTPSAGAHGAIAPDTPQAVDYGNNFTFNFNPATGYHVADVKVDTVSIGAPASYTFNSVTNDHAIDVQFAINVYDVNATVLGGHGTVDPATQQRDHGTDASIAIAPEDGYQIASITDNGATQPVADPFLINNVSADHDVVVAFEPIPITGQPIVQVLDPDRAPIGSTITVKGQHFGWRLLGGRGVKYALSPHYVMFNQTQATEYVSWNDTEIKVKVPSGATPGPLTVSTNKGVSNADHTFTPTYPLVPVYYLAEGSTDHGFDTYINIENPMEEDLNVAVNFLLSSGKVHTEAVGLPKLSQTTLNPADYVGEADFSTRVDCVQGKMIAVDRTMVWRGEDAASPEAHSSIGTMIPQNTWYMAEGSSAWGFETWTLIENPNDAATMVTISYMLEDGGVKEVDKALAPNSRGSFSMKDDIGVADASILVTSDLPVVAERSMYRNNRREGSCSIATPSPGSNFYLAEGTSAWGFTTYVLIENPNPSPTPVTVTYMTPKGPSVQPTLTMPATSRKTIRVNDTIKGTDFSVQVQSNKPIIAERAMYWDSAAGEACHASSGVCSSHETFYLPDGSTQEGVETYALVENPNASEVEIEITYLMPGGEDNISFTATVSANSRRTFSMNDKIPDGRAAIMVSSRTPGKGIVVERSMYWNARGAGTDTIGAVVDD